MANWPSLNASPPSLLYPPEGSKWWPRSGLAGTQAATALNGKAVSIIELRGWLVSVDGACNGSDPDWHYALELDLEWLDGLGLQVEQLLLPGDAISIRDGSAAVQGEVIAHSSVRAIYSLPVVEIELDAWQRIDIARGQPPKPGSWTFTNDCNGGAAVWPFDPRNPKPGDPPLQAGQYVRVVGSLVTDAPHMSQAWAATDWVLRFGYASALAVLGQQLADMGRDNAIKWLWGPNRGETDPGHPARWNEIHSPDYIEVLPPKARSENVRCVAVVAQNGLFTGDVESLQAQIAAPPRPTRWHALSMRKRVGPTTIASTVQVDEFLPMGNSGRLRAQVQGQGGLGASGKFHAVYRVGWRGIAPSLHGAVSTNGSTVLTGIDADGNLMVRPGSTAAPYWNAAWFGVQQGRGLPGGHITAVSRSAAHFDIFIAGNDRRIYTAAQSGGPWAGWWAIAGATAPPGAAVHAVSRRADNLDIFVADDAGRTMSAAWQPGFTAWHGWWWIQNGRTAPGGHVTAVSRRQDFLDIFCVGTDSQGYTAAWQPSATNAWGGWWKLAANASFPVGAPLKPLSRSVDKLDVFGADQQGHVMTTAWQPGAAAWQPWRQVLSGVTVPGGVVAAACRAPDLMDIFVIGTDGQVYTAAWSPQAGAWRGWWTIPGLKARQGTSIEAFSPAANVLMVTTSNEAGHLMWSSWSPSTGWVAWQAMD